MSDQSKPEPCYRDANNGVHFTRNAHRVDCAEDDCRGCRTCPERHCTARKSCTWHVAWGEITCGRCIAGVRTDLRWIGPLAALMPVQAMMDGVDSQAANLAGPAIQPHGWAERVEYVKHHLTTWHWAGKITDDQHVSALEQIGGMTDEHHPERVLSTWALMIAEDYDHPTPPRLTVSWCVDYLDRNLHRIAQDEEQDFELLRRELRKCRQHLEAVLHNDDRPDQGAPCPECSAARGKGPRLRRRYAQRWEAQDASRDEWVCPANREHRWSESDYRLRVADVYAEQTEATG